MHTIKAQRIIGGLLAISGAFYGAMAVAFPPLWLGYVIWFGWVAVACGAKRWQERWFWLGSLVWNLAITVFLIGSGWTSSIAKLFGLGHSLAAVGLSAYLSVIVPWDTWPENRKA
jgi:hypothetical protein